jgi:hypothetical protein
MYSHSHVKSILETSIDDLVEDFIRHPYKHRSEDSIHCELYAKLFEHKDLQELYPLKEGGVKRIGLVHKDWPETAPRPGKPSRRGHLDRVVLDPAKIAKHSKNDFLPGRIRPAFVIELGLNYSFQRIREDNEKLDFSKSTGGYLIHLLQPHNKITVEELAKLERFIHGSKHAVAAVVFSRSSVIIKRLRDKAMNSIL